MSHLRWSFLLGALLLMVSPGWAQNRAQLGINLDSVTDWEKEHPFANVMKCSRAWVSQPADGTVWDDGRALNLDAHGYVRSLSPGQIATTFVFDSTAQGTPTGQYDVLYEGEGTLEYSGNATLVSRSTGHDVVNVAAGQRGVVLSITGVNPANYLRNIRMMMPGTSDGDLFNSTFLDRIRSFACLRFMPWQAACLLAAPGTWNTRPVLEDCRWSVSWDTASQNRGVPVEVMVALCNRLGVDAWFSLPYTADDDYMARFAQYVAQNLDSRRRVYVEWSDEVHNSEYPQCTYAQQQGVALGLAADPVTAGVRYYALRSTQMFVIFEQYIPRDRLVRVLGCNAEDLSVSELELSFRDTAAHTDALACAPYFASSTDIDQTQALSWSLDMLFDWLRSTALPTIRDRVQAQMAVARAHGVPLLGYEGGQHLRTEPGALRDNPVLNALYDAANRDARMGGLYTQWLQDWNAAGGGLLMDYADCGRIDVYGRWGALEYISQPRSQAPKYDALMRYLESQQAAVDPAVTSPPAGARLTSDSTTLTWSAGTGVSQYWLYVGSASGGYDLCNRNEGTNLADTVTGLPTDGRVLYVRLWYMTAGGWAFVDYVYQAVTQ